MEPLFGQIAVRLGYVTPEDVRDALREQGGTSLRLGQILLRRKKITLERLLEVVRRQRKEVSVE